MIPRQRIDGHPTLCVCDGCKHAHVDYQRNRYREIAYGRWNPKAPVEPVRQHIDMLIAHGITQTAIAEAAGVALRQVNGVVRGRITGTVMADTSAAILGVTRWSSQPRRIESIGAVRRLRALAYNGWTTRQLGQVTRLDPQKTVRRILEGSTRVDVATDEKIRRAFADLWDVTPTSSTPQGRVRIEKTRQRAKNRRWAPPLAWDDIDDPAEQPTGMGAWRELQMSPAELVAEFKFLLSCGVSDEKAAEQLGVTLTYLRHTAQQRLARAA
jgi:transcriptional regulator with XRE-family HTH domain